MKDGKKPRFVYGEKVTVIDGFFRGSIATIVGHLPGYAIGGGWFSKDRSMPIRYAVTFDGCLSQEDADIIEESHLKELV